MLSSIVKATLLGWDGSFVGKKRKGVGEQALYVFFGWFGRQGTKLLLRKKSCQFKGLCFLWLETKLSIKDGPSTLVDFVGWVATR